MCLADVMSVGLLSDIRTVYRLIFTLVALAAAITIQIELLHSVLKIPFTFHYSKCYMLY